MVNALPSFASLDRRSRVDHGDSEASRSKDTCLAAVWPLTLLIQHGPHSFSNMMRLT